MKRVSYIVASVFIITFFIGCTTAPNLRRNVCDQKYYDRITENVSTQADILQTLGTPNRIYQSSSGENFVYDVTTDRQESIGKIFLGALLLNGKPTQSANLTISFDRMGIVKYKSYTREDSWSRASISTE